MGRSIDNAKTKVMKRIAAAIILASFALFLFGCSSGGKDARSLPQAEIVKLVDAPY